MLKVLESLRNLKLKEPTIILILILTLGGVLRFYGLNWDSGRYFHSDERNVLTSVSRISWEDLNPHFFVYGAFPVYINKILLSFANFLFKVDYPLLVLRFTSALFSLLVIWVTYGIGERLMGIFGGLISAAFLAVSVSFIQHSHYGTVEMPLIFFITLTIYHSLSIERDRSLNSYIKAGVSAGLGLGCKFSALFIIFPILSAHLLSLRIFKNLFRWKHLQKLLLSLLIMIAVSFVSSPYNYLDFKEFKKAMDYEGKVVLGTYIPNYTMAFRDTKPYYYQLKNMVLWGMGIPLGLTATIGFLFFAIYSLVNKEKKLLIVYSWALPYFLFVGSWQVKFMRYWLPLYPIFCLMAGYLVLFIIQNLKVLPRNKIRNGICGFIFGLSFLYALSFMSIYLYPNTRIQASNWFMQNAEEGSSVVTEIPWDEPIPVLSEELSKKRINIIAGLESTDLTHVLADRLIKNEITDDRKVAQIARKIKEANYITFGSKRVYGGLMKYSDNYKVSANFYRLVFSGALGFDLVAVFTQYPSFFGIKINDDFAEESFQTYDHPKILIFKKVFDLPLETIQILLENPPDPIKRIDRDYLITMDMKKFQRFNIDYSQVKSLAEREDPEKGKLLNEYIFNQPRDIDVDDEGWLYVADFRNHQVVIFDHNQRLVKRWGGKGSGIESFNDLCGIAVDKNFNIYVADTWNHRIQKFDRNGIYLLSIYNLYAPRAVAVDEEGNLYVSDSGNCLIKKFNPSGELIKEWGGRGSGEGQLSEPIGITVSKKSEVFVCDTWNKRIQVFDKNGIYLRQWAVDAWAGEAFREPYCDLTSNGDLIVSDPPTHRILRYSPTGEFKGVVELYNIGGKDLSFPMGIAIDKNDQLFIADTMNHRIIKTSLK